MKLKVSRKGAKFVGHWEGFLSCAYRDAVGVWTIGYGTTAATGRPVHAGLCISERKARRWLRKDLNRYVAGVPRRRRLRRCEVDALASFAYNHGPGVLEPGGSTLAARLHGPEGKRYKTRKRVYREELPKWNKAGGRPLEGLTKRRRAEVRLACKGDYSGRP